MRYQTIALMANTHTHTLTIINLHNTGIVLMRFEFETGWFLEFDGIYWQVQMKANIHFNISLLFLCVKCKSWTECDASRKSSEIQLMSLDIRFFPHLFFVSTSHF